MITDINYKAKRSEIDRTKLPPYWEKYFEYETDDELFNLSKNEFIKEIEAERIKEKPFIDSQIVISRLLTKFGEKHIFHRHFREKHPGSDSGQVLGMQLYHIMLEDKEIWVYCDIKKSGHLYSNATYFK